MVKLTRQEKKMLGNILTNQYASGPFSGMVYNQVAQNLREDPTQDTIHAIDSALKIALQTKIRLSEVAEQ